MTYKFSLSLGNVGTIGNCKFKLFLSHKQQFPIIPSCTGGLLFTLYLISFSKAKIFSMHLFVWMSFFSYNFTCLNEMPDRNDSRQEVFILALLCRAPSVIAGRSWWRGLDTTCHIIATFSHCSVHSSFCSVEDPCPWNRAAYT